MDSSSKSTETKKSTGNPRDTSTTQELSEYYDFIIVGGGTAGLVLASRLSEDSNIQVLVVEAGSSRLDDPKILTPGMVESMYDDPTYNWSYWTVPQKELNGRKIPYQCGKVLGGSSATSRATMVFNTKSAFDAWEKKGNPGWNWDNMLPYMQKFHTHHDPSEKFHEISDISHRDEAVKSNQGPVQTSYSETGSVDRAWYETWWKIMSYYRYPGNKLGGFAAPAAIDPRTLTRSYAGTAYYSPDISSRPNLRVVTEALVEKILMEAGADVVASGVRFRSKSGRRFDVRARKEVILSAGVIQSPQLLELSGVGGQKLLNHHNIVVLVDNPNVGENLQDHATCAISFEVEDGIQTAESMLRDPEVLESFVSQYEQDHSGPLGKFFANSAQMLPPETFEEEGEYFLPNLLSSLPKYTTQTPTSSLHQNVTLDLLSQPDGATAHYFMVKFQINLLNSPSFGERIQPRTPGNYFTLCAALNHPFSRGNIHISSTSPTGKPIIDPKYLSHPLDIEILARHIQFFSILLKTHPLSFFFKDGGRQIPAQAFTKGHKPPSLEVAKELARQTLLSSDHLAGTCMMGRRTEGGVVNSRLIVHGVKNLRVVDSSIFPIMPRGNIITSVYAVAERAADLIKEDWGMCK